MIGGFSKLARDRRAPTRGTGGWAWGGLGEEGGGEGENGFGAAGEAQAVGGGGADRYLGVAGGREHLLGLFAAGPDPRAVADDLDRDVADLEPGGAHPPRGLRDKRHPGSTRPLRLGGPEVRPQVAQL